MVAHARACGVCARVYVCVSVRTFVCVCVLLKRCCNKKSTNLFL